MRKTVLRFLIPLIAIGFAAVATQADVLVSFDAADVTIAGGDSSIPTDVVHPAITASSIQDNDDAPQPPEWGSASTLQGQAVYGFSTRSLNGSGYFDFTVTPSPTGWLDVETLTFNSFAVNNIGGVGSAGANFRVRWSGDGFASDIASMTGALATGGGTQASLPVTADLSSIGRSTTPVTLRVYLDQNGSPNGTFGQRGVGINNIVLNGTAAAVPEPSSWALLGVCGVGMIVRRKMTAKVADQA